MNLHFNIVFVCVGGGGGEVFCFVLAVAAVVVVVVLCGGRWVCVCFFVSKQYFINQ